MMYYVQVRGVDRASYFDKEAAVERLKEIACVNCQRLGFVPECCDVYEEEEEGDRDVA